MILTKRNSRNDLATLNNFIDGFLNHNLAKTDLGSFTNKPMVNIVESKDNFELHIALPGIAKEHININVDGDLLTISNTVIENEEVQKEEGTKEEGTIESNETKFLRKEFSFNSFKRTFTLPDTVNATLINATNENGILTITLPKKEEAKAVKKVISIS